MFNDGLEEAWGELKASIYVYSVLACMIFAQFLGKNTGGFGGITLYAQLFFAFATLFPRVEFHLFLILPIKVWVLGVITGGILLFGVLQAPGYAHIILLPSLPYLFWAFPRLLKWYVTRGQTVARRAKFQQGVRPEGEAFHHCAQCGATDSSFDVQVGVFNCENPIGGDNKLPAKRRPARASDTQTHRLSE